MADGFYREYLDSPKWWAKRDQVLERAQGICEKCEAFKVVHVHHLTYKRLGNERLEDLQAVCLPCHQAYHPDKDIGRPRVKRKKVSMKKKRRDKWKKQKSHARKQARAFMRRRGWA